MKKIRTKRGKVHIVRSWGDIYVMCECGKWASLPTEEVPEDTETTCKGCVKFETLAATEGERE